MPAGNLLLSAAILFSGSHFSKVQQLFRDMNMACISRTTFDNYQNKCLLPVVLNSWVSERKHLVHQLADMNGGLVLAGDGRADSPGHSAKYGSYSMLELRINKVVDIQLVQASVFTVLPQALPCNVQNSLDLKFCIAWEKISLISKWALLINFGVICCMTNLHFYQSKSSSILKEKKVICYLWY